jgi:aminopeptidase N
MIALLLATAIASPPPHARPALTRHFDVSHLDLDVRLDPEAGTVAGTSTVTVRPLGAPYGWLRLHQGALDVREVRVDGGVVTGWRLGEQALDIPMPVTAGPFQVAVDYGARPEQGLFFRGPSRGDTAIEVWSQGEEEENRFWFPGWDHPSDKFTVSMAVTAPSGLTVFATGVERGAEPAGPGLTKHRFALDQEVTGYHVALAAGEYTVTRKEGRVPLVVAVPRGVNVSTATASAFQVEAMMPWMEARFGVPYPYPVYRQVVTQRFLYIGMENPTVTTLAVSAVTPPSDPRPLFAENVLAHELAHHWFGDLITTRGWSDLWLNEGFATLVATDWVGERVGAAWRADDVVDDRDASLWNGHPMAPRAGSTGVTALYDGEYVQGHTVLRWARHTIGTPAFDRSVHRLLTENAHGFVTSEALRRLLEDESGVDLGWLFDTFVHGEGHPTVKAAWSWGDGALRVELDPSEDGWHFPVDVEIGTDPVVRRTLWIDGGDATLQVDLPTAPRWVAVDPDAVVLARWEVEQDAAAWQAQARWSPTWEARRVALPKVAELGGDGAADTLVAAVAADRPYTWNDVAVRALGELRSDESTAALTAWLSAADPTLREPAAAALADAPRSAALGRRLSDVATTDADDRTRAAALRAWLRHDREGALRFARAGALRGGDELRRAALHIIGQEGSERDLASLYPFLSTSSGSATRRAAADATVAVLGRLDDDARRDAAPHVEAALAPLLDDADLDVRYAGVFALSRVPGAGPRLLALSRRTTIPALRDAARDAATAAPGPADTEAPDHEALTEDLDTIRDRLRALEERLDRVETWR